MIPTPLFGVGYEVRSSPLPLGVVTKALGVPIVTDPVYPYDKSPPIDEVMSHITNHLSNGVLILGSRLLRLLRPHICFFELLVIPCGPFLISIPSLWSDVCFYMRLCLVLLSDRKSTRLNSSHRP